MLTTAYWSLATIFRRRYSFVVACLLAFSLLFSAYANHFHNAFHFDDSHVIEQNLYIRSLHNLPRFFTDAQTFSSLPANAVYRPLLSVTFAFDYWRGGGLDPWQFHVTQFGLLVLLGAGLTVLFLSIMNRAAENWWNRYAALFAALLFCLHTANTETINYLSSRSDLLSTLGVIGAFLMYLFLPRWRRFYCYLAPMILGALAKPPAVIFAPLLLVYLVLFDEHSPSGSTGGANTLWPNVWPAIRKALPACGVGLLLFVFINAMNPPTFSYGGGSRWHYLLTQSFVWLHYVRLFFIPVGLSADTDWTLITQWYDTRVFAGVGAIGGLASLAWKYAQTQAGRPVAYGIAWFGLALLPSSSLFPLAEVANEHRIFFPYIGLSLAVVWGVALHTHRWLAARTHLRPVMLPAVGLFALLVLGGHVVGTYQRNTVWRSAETLWRDVVEKSPANGRAWMNYGLTQMAQGKYAEAKRLFEQAQRYSPNYAHLEVNLAIVTDRLGESAVAEQHFQRALFLQPEFADGHYYYAQWLVQHARAGEGIPHLQRAVALSPGLPYARALLMDLYAAQGAEAVLHALARETLTVLPTDRAAQAYLNGETLTTLDPPNAQHHYNRGVTLTNAGRHLDAALAYRQALRLDPLSADTVNNLGWSLAKLGFYTEAMLVFEQAVRLRPGFTLAENNLAWVRTQITPVK